MIDATNITKFDRSEAELQEYWLFCLVVAGKTAIVQARHLEIFLTRGIPSNLINNTPFEKIKWLDENNLLLDMIKASKLGQYTRLEKAFKASINLNLATATLDDLESIPGVGAKTSRYFMLHSRPNQRIAALDTHMMRHLRDLGLTTLKTTPPKGPKYEVLEKQFIALADAAKMSIADFDLMLWNRYARKARKVETS